MQPTYTWYARCARSAPPGVAEPPTQGLGSARREILSLRVSDHEDNWAKAETNPDSDSHADADTNPDSDCHAEPNSHSDSHSKTDGDSESDSKANRYPDTDSKTDGHTYTNSFGYWY